MTHKIILFILLSCDFLLAKTPSTILQTDSLSFSKQGEELLAQTDMFAFSPDSNLVLVKQALEFFEKAENWEKIVDSYNTLSIYHFLKNEFDQSERWAQKGLNLAEKKLGKVSLGYTDALFNIITILNKEGFSREAIDKFLEIIELDKALNTPKANVIISYQNLALAYLSIGDYEEAIEAINNALRLQKELASENKGEQDIIQADIGTSYAGLADCYYRKKDYNKALEIFNQSLNTLHDFDKNNEYVNQTRYICYYKLADIYFKFNKRDSAFIFANKAVAINEKFNIYDGCHSYATLGKLHLKNNPSKAMQYFDASIGAAIQEAENFSNFPNVALAYTEKGKALLQLQKYDQALTAFQKGLQITAVDFDENELSKNPRPAQIIQKLNALNLVAGKARAFKARFSEQSQNIEDLENAYRHFILAADLVQLTRQDYNTEAAKFTLADIANQLYESAIETCALLFEKTKNKQYIETAFVFAESNKAITLLESINKATALSLSGLPDSLMELERQLNIQLNFENSQLAKLKTTGAEKQIIKKLEERRFRIREDYKNLILHVEKNYPKYYELKYINTTSTISKIQEKLLDESTAFIEYFVGAENIYSFLITQKEFAMNSFQRNSDFDNLILTLKHELETAPDSETFLSGLRVFNKHANQLYNLLFDKHKTALNASIDQLIIVPDDIISLIPFEVLLMEAAAENTMTYCTEKLSYLLNEYSISYSYSGTLSLNQKKSRSNSVNAFIAFAPTFTNQSEITQRSCGRERLHDLGCASNEVKRINNYFDGEVLKEEDAGKMDFMSTVEKYEIIHLATHACIDEENAMLSKIHFSDDYITMFDLYNLKLNANLVVLSACNTGSGKMIKGEGVLSLSRGFIQSGATSTVMSLWAVDDCATSELMTNFYKNLKNNKAKNQALREAKLNYINSASDKIEAHPYYWAAFVQSGDPGTLPGKPYDFIFYLSISGAVLLFLTGFYFYKNRSYSKN